MKKILRKIMAIAAAVTLVSAFASCSGDGDDGTDDTSDKSPAKAEIWAGATMIDDLAGKEVNWDKGGPLVVPSAISKRLQSGSKIIVQLGYNNIAADYIQFHVEDGSWGAVGVKDYYNEKGSKVASIEEEDSKRYKIDVEPGVYYTVVTDDVLDKLKLGLGFGGNFKLVKVGITNLGESEKEPEAAKDGDVVYTAKSDELSISVAQNAYDAGDGDGVMVQGIQFVESGAKYLPAGAKAGDVYEINLVGKADAEFNSRVQFLASNWAGIVKPVDEEEIPLTTFTAADFDFKLQVKFTENTADGFKFVIGKTEKNAVAHTLTLTKFTITKISSGSAGDNTDPAPTETAVEVFSGSQTINWGENGLVIDHAKFTAEFNALRITYNASAGALKLAVCDPWTDITATSTSGGSIAADGAINLPTGDAQTVTIAISAESAAAIVGQNKDGAWGGVKLYGADTITITKVEALKVE